VTGKPDSQLAMTVQGRRVRAWVNPAALVPVGRSWRRMERRWVVEIEELPGPRMGPVAVEESEEAARIRLARWIDLHLWGEL
jgi:hypothetical protein